MNSKHQMQRLCNKEQNLQKFKIIKLYMDLNAIQQN